MFLLRVIIITMFYTRRKMKLKDLINGGVDVISMSDYKWDYLKNSITQNGYTPSKYGYIKVNLRNVIQDGHHRRIVLTELYGEDYEVVVKRYTVIYTCIVFLLYAIVVGLFLTWSLISYLTRPLFKKRPIP